MSLRVDPNQSSVRATVTEQHQRFIDLQSKLNALYTPKEPPADTDWDWDTTSTTATTEHKALIKKFFHEDQPSKTEAVIEDDFFA